MSSSSSLHENHMDALGSTVQAGNDEATTNLDICESLHHTNVPSIHVSTTSGNSPDAYLMNDHPITSMANREEEKLLEENICENPVQIEELGLGLHEQDYIKKIKELHVYLDTVKEKVRPGCSQELLKVAVSSMSSVAKILTVMSSTAKLHAAL